MTPVVFISAGEASGEHYGALLAAELRREMQAAGQAIEIWGMGGPQMEAASVERVVHSEDVAVMGFTEIVTHLPRIYREYRKLKRAIRARRSDVAVLIDFPEIHFRLAREFKRLGVPVIYFVSPQIWAWKQHRIKLVQEYVRRMLVIFPFEEGFYRERGVEAEYVGHPLAELPLPEISREQFAAESNLDLAKHWIGLLPGSRIPEILKNLQGIVEAAAQLGKEYEYIIPLAPTLTEKQVARIQYDLSDRMLSPQEKPPRITFVRDARAALFHARASVVASGTATVEAALMGNPFVVVYRVSRLTYAIARRVVKVPHVAMANLIAGRRLVPELIQEDFTAANIVKQLKPLLPDGPVRESMKEDLGVIRSALRAQTGGRPGEASGAIERVAQIVLQTVEPARPPIVGPAR
jgi:lipid-A-disaccharide synthase